MNAAVKTLNPGLLSSTWGFASLFNKRNFLLITLCITIIVSALSVIYVTNETRALYASLQQQHTERDQLHIQRSQLLLEQGTFSSQARIKRIAMARLGMEIPLTSTVIMVNETD